MLWISCFFSITSDCFFLLYRLCGVALTNRDLSKIAGTKRWRRLKQHLSIDWMDVSWTDLLLCIRIARIFPLILNEIRNIFLLITSWMHSIVSDLIFTIAVPFSMFQFCSSLFYFNFFYLAYWCASSKNVNFVVSDKRKKINWTETNQTKPWILSSVLWIHVPIVTNNVSSNLKGLMNPVMDAWCMYASNAH